MDLEKQGYERLSKHAEPGSPKYKSLRRKASRAGALVTWNNEEYIHRLTIFEDQREQNKKKKEARAQRKDSEISAYRYRKIKSLRVLARLEGTISSGISNKKSKKDEIDRQIKKEDDLLKANDLKLKKGQLESLLHTSDQKLKAIRDRMKEIERDLGKNSGSDDSNPSVPEPKK